MPTYVLATVTGREEKNKKLIEEIPCKHSFSFRRRLQFVNMREHGTRRYKSCSRDIFL